ncbi:MAG: cysteine desulfurase family protein [Candidatus Paceibacterota bacterium]|jgi:cysteine desulfurase
MSKSNKIYLDSAASVEANPSSIHSVGVGAKTKLENSRREVARVLGARPEEIIFTSGDTESNNLALQGVVWAWHESKKEDKKEKKLPHIITTNIEHPSVLETCRMLQDRNLAQVSIIGVEENGIIDFKKIKKAIRENTILVSVMYANNEIGTIQPIREIAKEIRHYKKTKQTTFPFFHTDAVQVAGYLDLDVARLGVDLLSLSGAKIKESGWAGVLFKRKSIPLAKVYAGGDQEMGLRPGTENLAEIIKFSRALRRAQKIIRKEIEILTRQRDYFIKKLLKMSPDIIINGDLENRLPNNVNITVPKIPSDLLVIELSAKGIMVSSRSACKSSTAKGSYVISALRKDANPEIGGVRFSLNKNTTKDDIDYTINILSQILKKLKKWYN